jgi:hypothetical protein
MMLQRGELLGPRCEDESWIAAFLAYVIQFAGSAKLGRVWPELTLE